MFRKFAVLFVLSMLPLFAQEEEREKKDTLNYDIDEITIVGTRVTEKIIDIPYSVFKVDKKELGYGKKVNARDVLADVPGLILQNRYGNNDLRISLRGYGTRSNSGVRGVRILQDGIPESEPDGETVVDAVDFTSLGGVEVVKGNLSSLYANAPGGVINFVTDFYFPQPFVTTANQAGAFGFRQNGFKAGLKGEGSRFFITYNYRTMDGFRSHSGEYHNLANAIYEAVIGTSSTLTLLGNYTSGMVRIPGSLSAVEYAADPFAANPVAASQDFTRTTSKGRLALKYRSFFGNNGKDEAELVLYGGIKEQQKRDMDYFSLSTRYSMGILLHATLHGMLFGRAHKLSAGVDYAWQSGPVTDFDNVAGKRGLSVQNHYDQSLGNAGVYLFDHLNLLPGKFDLFLSGRFDYNKFIRGIYIPFGLTDTSREFTKFTPKAALNFKLTPEVALYTSYGLGYDFPALSEMGNNPFTSNVKYALNPDLKGQKSKNFEVGIKASMHNAEEEFMRKLFLEVTYFDYTISNEIVPFVVNQRTYFQNAGITKRRGVECGFKSEPFEEVELVVNYTFTNFTYNEFITTVVTPGGSSVVDYSGNSAPAIPRGIFNFILNHEYEIGSKFSGLLQYDCDYITRMPVNDANNEYSAPYFYINLMAGINYTDERYNAVLFLGMNNLLNRRYAGFININEFFGRYYETGEPRAFYAGLNLSYKY